MKKGLSFCAVVVLIGVVLLICNVSCSGGTAQASDSGSSCLTHGVLRIEANNTVLDTIEVYLDGEYLVTLRSGDPGVDHEFYEKAVSIGTHTISGTADGGPTPTFSDTVYVPEQGLTWMPCYNMLSY